MQTEEGQFNTDCFSVQCESGLSLCVWHRI